MRVLALALAVLTALATLPATAVIAGADEPADRAAAVTAVLSCRSVGEATARLACLDSALIGLAHAFPKSAGAESGPSAEHVAAAEAAAFGAEDLPSDRTADDRPRTLRARVVQTETTAFGKLVFTLDNGQVWRQIDADGGAPRVPGGDAPYAVTIRRKLLGSHRLSIEGERPAVTVRRVK